MTTKSGSLSDLEGTKESFRGVFAVSGEKKARQRQSVTSSQ